MILIIVAMNLSSLRANPNYFFSRFDYYFIRCDTGFRSGFPNDQTIEQMIISSSV